MRWLIPLVLMAGCAVRDPVRGLVQVTDGQAELTDLDGGTWALGLTEDSEPLLALEGATVGVTGRRVGQRIHVEGWTVISAVDGSAPYVGMLRRHGSNLVIDDRNSGVTLILQAPAAVELGALAGHIVMVVGYVTGPHVIQVVGVEQLD